MSSKPDPHGNANFYAIRLPPDVRSQLNEVASAQGLKPRTLARQLITEGLAARSQSKTA